MRIHILCALIPLQLLTVAGRAQYFQFSQINYSEQRVNPALVGASDYAMVNLLYRNQTTGGDFNLNSTMVSASYPLISARNGQRWSGFGLSLLDDRTGGIYAIQEASLSYAANVYLARYQSLSLGVKGMFQQRRIDLDGLFTGMQYIPDRGFDGTISSGEGFNSLRNDFFTLSLGMFWQQLDRDDNRLAYASLSFFDFNKPSDTFLETGSQLRTTVVAAGGLRIYKNGPLSITPEFLYTGNYSNHTINLGAVFQYELRPMPNQVAGRVEVITKYVVGRSGILGLQLHRDSFSVGFSYDFPVFYTNPGNLGAFEIGIQLRRLVDPKQRRARKKTPKPARETAVSQNTSATAVTAVGQKQDSTRQTEVKEIIKPDSTTTQAASVALKESIRQKQDSLYARAIAGDISRDPVELEKVVLRFGFEYNSTAIDAASQVYLKDLAGLMNDNPHLRLKLTGYTDNVGSEGFNLRLSQARAEQIKKLIVGEGVAEDRIETEGKGMQDPLNDNATEEDRALNRRVEMRIIYAY